MRLNPSRPFLRAYPPKFYSSRDTYPTLYLDCHFVMPEILNKTSLEPSESRPVILVKIYLLSNDDDFVLE